MSDNNIQSIKKVLTRQNNGLTIDEIESVCGRISKKANLRKFEKALTDDLDNKNARASLEGMMMYWTGDIDLATKVVTGSETTSNDAKQEDVKCEIRYRDQNWGTNGDGWNRHNDQTTGSDSNLESSSQKNKEYSPQKVLSGNGKFYSDFDHKKREVMKDINFR